MNLPVDWWKAMGSPDMAVLAVLGCGEKICFPWERLVKLRDKNRRLAISEVVKRDGVSCFFCGLPYGSDPCLEFTLHHVDWKNTHNHLHNLKVAHGGCNISEIKKHEQRLKRPSSVVMLGVRESEKRRLGHLHVMPEVGDGYSSVKNAEVEPLWRKWVFEMVKVHRGEDYLTRGNLVCDGGELIGFNPKSGYPYFGRLIAPIYGCLEWGLSKSGKRIVQFRLEADYSLSADELCDKYPWEGQRFALERET